MADDKEHTEQNDSRIAPSSAPEAQATEAPDATLSGDADFHDASRKRTRRAAVIGGALLACAALIALVVGLNYPSIASLGAGDAFKTTTQSADQEQQTSNAKSATRDEKKDTAEKEADKAAADAASAKETEAADASSASKAATDSGAPAGGNDVSAGQSPAPAEPAPEPDPQPVQPTTVTVSVSISSSAVGGPVSGGANPTLSVGATVYDALLSAGVSVNAGNGPYGMYVSAIGGLAEKEHGGTSGWKYSVNGVEPGTSCSNYVLKDGDSIQWYYVV
ncbi:MAG: DUF4430 domain-containing protein [Raoultibacter sp.]